MSVTEIEQRSLSFRGENVRNRLWDQQIEVDLESGKLDSILAEVDAEIESGSAKPL